MLAADSGTTTLSPHRFSSTLSALPEFYNARSCANGPWLSIRSVRQTRTSFQLLARGKGMPSLTRRDLLRSGVALSASTLVPGSVQRARALLARYADAPSSEATSAVA